MSAHVGISHLAFEKPNGNMSGIRMRMAQTLNGKHGSMVNALSWTKAKANWESQKVAESWGDGVLWSRRIQTTASRPRVPAVSQ
jgi:hypothetical protein